VPNSSVVGEQRSDPGSRAVRGRIVGLGVGSGLVALSLGLSCNGGPGVAPIDALALPTGLNATPDGRWLFVTNGNWDRANSASALLALDLEALENGLAQAGAAGTTLDRGQPCRTHAEGDRLECAVAGIVEADLGVRLPSGAGNITIDRPSGPGGPLRLLIPTRLDPGVTWIDVYGPGFGASEEAGLRLECGQDEGRFCDREHRLSGVAADPARLFLDQAGFRFAYLPHLTGRTLTMLALDGARGPEVVDVEDEFFREDGLFDSGLGGGFAVVQRACDLEGDNVPADSGDCTRPYLFASQRFWWGLRAFQVAPGLKLVVRGSESTVFGPNLEAADARPLMGGLAFEDPDQGERLLAVHTTPPALSRIDTSLDAQGDPKVEVMATVSLCSNPNVVVVHRPDLSGALGPRLALVSCYGSDEVAVVDLGLFAVVATVGVGDGPNELWIDVERQWLFVANTAESTLSLIELDAGSVDYLREFATIGLR